MDYNSQYIDLIWLLFCLVVFYHHVLCFCMVDDFSVVLLNMLWLVLCVLEYPSYNTKKKIKRRDRDREKESHETLKSG